jgi:hypothetical protein
MKLPKGVEEGQEDRDPSMMSCHESRDVQLLKMMN